MGPNMVNRRIPVLSLILPATFIVLAVLSQGCGTRSVIIRPLDSGPAGANPLPMSVRVDVKNVEQANPPPFRQDIDKASLKQALMSDLKRRNTFRDVMEGPADGTLSIDVSYQQQATGFSAGFAVNMDGLLASRDGLILGRYTGHSWMEGLAQGLNQAVNGALSDLLLKIEDSRNLILAALRVSPQPSSGPAPEAAAAVRSDVDELPGPKARPNKNAYALVIGLERYRQKLPNADFAVHDAQAVTEYLTKVLGYPEENVVMLLNDHATKGDLEKYFEKWLGNNVERGGTVFVYFSGHGAPEPRSGSAYLVPYDGDPSFIDQTGYPLKRMYEALGKLPAKKVIVALDSCFSGAGGRSVIAKGARPLVLKLQDAGALAGNMTVMAAASSEQISSTYDEKGHGLFTYFLLKGIKNEDVTAPDGSLRIDDLYGYVKPQVERIARKQYNNEQSPQLIAPRN